MPTMARLSARRSSEAISKIMPPDGKYAEGLKGFPTPNLVPADGGYIVFKIPRDNEWAGLILGAAQLLAQSYNWYQWGDMTPDEAAEAFRVIVNQAPYDTCGCNQPSGSRVLRINNDGHIQQLTDGEWTEPTDDYAIPPVPPREEPTCEERRCAAAANAANVLQQLYEEVADAVAEGADEAEALAVMIGTAVIIIGGWLGLALAALVGLITGGFFAFLEIAEFMTADLWTSDFTEKLKCFLYECSSCDGDVVTFDFQCVRDKMAKYTDILDPNVITNIRLFGQVDFILNVIGVDGLNAAGATTAIEIFDCGECAPDCISIDFTEESYPYTFIPYPATSGTASVDPLFGDPAPSAKGYSEGDGMFFGIEIEFDTPRNISALSFHYYQHNPFHTIFVREMVLRVEDGTVVADVQSVTGALENEWDVWTPFGSWDGNAIKKVQLFMGISGGDAASGECWMDDITICFE